MIAHLNEDVQAQINQAVHTINAGEMLQKFAAEENGPLHTALAARKKFEHTMHQLVAKYQNAPAFVPSEGQHTGIYRVDQGHVTVSNIYPIKVKDGIKEVAFLPGDVNNLRENEEKMNTADRHLIEYFKATLPPSAVSPVYTAYEAMAAGQSGSVAQAPAKGKSGFGLS